MSPEHASWSVVLDAMEERLHQAERLLAGKEFREVTVPPGGIGGLPPALARRAHELLEATARMEQKLEEAMAGLSVRMAGTRSWQGDVLRPAPSYIDRSA